MKNTNGNGVFNLGISLHSNLILHDSNNGKQDNWLDIGVQNISILEKHDISYMKHSGKKGLFEMS